jgi:nucleotide-binding universal stress UspA family protein
MSYKTLLVHVDEAKEIDTRIGIAAQLALTENAHLIGAAMTGVSRFLYNSMAIDPGEPSIMSYLGSLRQRAEGSLQRFENAAQRIGVGSFERRLVDDEAAGGISLQARYCDLVIIGQYDPNGTSSSVYADVPEYVVINSGCPALIVPYAGSFDNFGDRVLIAWNESIEATRAVHNALPLLKRAKTVDVVVFNSAKEPDVFGEQPGTDIALYLARHDVKVDVHQEQTGVDTGNALLSLAANLNSNLLVMGCYGHTRLREILLGGATRTILQSMTIPVLMAH